MSLGTVNNYRFFCNTENTYVTMWNTDTPTKCPNNNQDHIDLNSITITDSINSNSINIIQYTDSIQGLYRVTSRSMFIPSRQTVSEDFSFDIPISILSMSFTTTKQNTGDIINCYVSPNTTIGVITQNISNGDKVIHVSPTVIKNIKRGYMVNLTNGSNILNMGECISINPNNNTIKCDTEANSNINAGAYLQITIHNIKDFIVGPPSAITFNNKTLQSTYIPANTILRLVYQNNSNIDTTFYRLLEYLY